MHVLASDEVNSLIIPLSNLRDILLEVKNEICSHPRLALPNDLHENIWEYCLIMCVPPIVMEYFLIAILSIPLIDNCLEMDLYRVHNLPTLQLEL